MHNNFRHEMTPAEVDRMVRLHIIPAIDRHARSRGV